MTSRFLLKELYWIGIILLSSYLIIAINTSFSLSEAVRICKNSLIQISKPVIIVQLALVLIITRALFNYILRIENQKIRYFMIPLVVFALPISIILLWLQLMGC
jgi:hypothetical protein